MTHDMEPSRAASVKQPREKKRSTGTPVGVLAAQAIDAVLEKKAHDVHVMDLRGISGVADVFVICTGDSDLQIKAIVDNVSETIREQYGEKPWHVEGYEHFQWVLLDYVDLVVHVLTAEKRAFYGLERLWGDAPAEEVPDTAQAADVKLIQQLMAGTKRDA